MRKLAWGKIKSSPEYRKIISSGKKYITPFFIAFSCESDILELGVIASRKVGGAVQRNQAKRLLRNAFSDAGMSNTSTVLIAKSAILEAEYSELVKLIKKLKNRRDSKFVDKVVPNI